MDKYEYKLKTEQMLELMEDGSYRKAAGIADEIDWKRVRNVTMLTNVSDIYEKNKEYQKSYDVLRIAYHRAEGSRKVIYRLCTLALKTGNVDEAIDYYDDFMQIAPKDPNQHILRYQILRAQRAPVEQQIEALEEFKKAEYIEEWAYELAKLYQEAGMTAECLEECDDLILWFSEGQYVYKAMELKMQYKPLTPSQQEKYDHRYEKPSSETEEMPDLETYVASGKAEPAEAVGSRAEEIEDVAAEPATEEEGLSSEPEFDGNKKIGSTMRLDEALKKLLHKDEEGAGNRQDDQEDEDISDLAEEIEDIEAVADLGMAERVSKEETEKRDFPASGGIKELIADEADEDIEEMEIDAEGLDISGAEEFLAEAEGAGQEELSEDDGQIEGQMSLEDIMSGWESRDEEKEEYGEEELKQPEPEVELEIEEPGEPEPEVELEIEEPGEPEPEPEVEPETEDPKEAAAEAAGEAEPKEEPVAAGEAEAEEGAAVEAEPAEEENVLDGEEAEDLTEGETTGETMAEKKKTEPILPPDIQRMIDEIEGVIPPEESDPLQERKEGKPEEPRENMEEVAEDLRIDDEIDLEDEDSEDFWGDDLEDDAAEEFVEEEFPGDYEEQIEDDFGEEYEEEYEEDPEYDGFAYGEAEEILEDDAEELTDETEIPDFDEEFRVGPEYGSEPDDREVPDDDADEMDILSATTPLSRKETAKMIATGKTAPLPLDEISDALSMSDTGFIVHGRYDLQMQSGIGTRAGLTEEQKKLFSYFVPVRGMSEQLVDVLEQDKNCTNREGTSRTGNLLIIGNKGNGKTVLAVDVVKAIQKQRNIRQGKVAIVTGESLNKKKIGDIFSKLYGGALIIEKAGKLHEKTVARLNKAMEKDTGEMLIVLEEQRKPLDRLLSSNREFRRKFTSRLEVPIFINDELVTFGQTYAQENGYRIDEMGILALYSRIDSLQREDHAVTVAEVKEVMDKAIQHSQKASAKKLVKRVFGKNTDEADRILLSEKDFNN